MKQNLYTSKFENVRRRGYTLSEVLITIAVIGVIAALTIPTMLNNMSKKVYLSAYKKRYAEISTAIKASVLENKTTSKWNHTLDSDTFFKKYLAPYLKVKNCDHCWTAYAPKGHWFERPAYAKYYSQWYYEECYPGDGCYLIHEECVQIDGVLANNFSSTNKHGIGAVKGFWFEQPAYAAYVDPNPVVTIYPPKAGPSTGDGYAHVARWGDPRKGTSEVLAKCTKTKLSPSTPPAEPMVTYSFNDGAVIGLTQTASSMFYLYIDVNGKAEPNVYGLDKYVFTVSDDEVLPYGYSAEDLIAGDYGCSATGNGMMCGAMIMKNNWEFPDNYAK